MFSSKRLHKSKFAEQWKPLFRHSVDKRKTPWTGWIGFGGVEPIWNRWQRDYFFFLALLSTSNHESTLGEERIKKQRRNKIKRKTRKKWMAEIANVIKLDCVSCALYIFSRWMNEKIALNRLGQKWKLYFYRNNKNEANTRCMRQPLLWLITIFLR